MSKRDHFYKKNFFWLYLGHIYMALNFSYMAFQLIIYISDHSVWWMHRGWRKGLAYDTFCLFWMWQTTWRSALYYARRPALLFGLFWLHVCWILWCLWRNYWSGPRPDDPWRPALARHWQLFLLSSLSNIIIGPAFFAKTWPYLLFGVLFQRRIFNGQKQVRQRLLLLLFLNNHTNQIFQHKLFKIISFLWSFSTF